LRAVCQALRPPVGRGLSLEANTPTNKLEWTDCKGGKHDEETDDINL
jgi:hypothetical protein